MAKKSSDYTQLVFRALKKIGNQRTRDIISLRYGLLDGQRKTLEAVGQSYDITRERVRQVEEAAFSVFRENENMKLFKPVFRSVDNFLSKEGGLVREERALSSFSTNAPSHPSRSAIFFILTLNPSYQRFVETEEFYPCWAKSKQLLVSAAKINKEITKKLKQENAPLSFKPIYNYVSKERGIDISERALASYLDASKLIEKNTFDCYGLSRWPEINPRGAKDKAYVIFQKESRPLHFKEAASLINKAGLGKSKAQPQTVHNELIKDSRFVLVGRGTYALKDWGYPEGTVKDVIAQILKKEKALSREEVIERVLQKRVVKPNTILINLQNRTYFTRDKQGRYMLR